MLPNEELDIFMTHGTLNVRLRPIKLAFLVNPKDKDSLLKAIEINTFLWGGMFNPIIPTYRRIPQKWEYGPFKNPDAQSVISGYLDNFDPDYVIPMGECSGYPFDVGNREKIDDTSEILAPVKEDGVPNYGIGLFEVLNYFIEQELKFQRRYPLDICIPRFGNRLRPFLASVFGTFPENIDTIFWENFAEVLEAKEINCSASNYTELLNPQKLFLRRMTQFYLESTPSLRGWKQCIFLLDATNSLDVMDYWNLRAIGWNVIPVPKQFTRFEKTKRLILDFIEANYVPHHSNPEIYHHTTILKSRSISEDEYQHFRDSLDIPISDETNRRPKVMGQFWYPPMWDEWARENQAECCDLEAETDEHDISTNQEMVRFKTLDPKFISRFGGYGKSRFVNEIKLRLYDEKELFAEVIPEGGRELAKVIGGFNLFDWRLSRKGLVYLSRHSKWLVSLSLPQAEALFTNWLELKGWTVELSSAGRIAKQMIRQLGGINGTWILAQEGIIQLLGEMNSSDEKSMSEADLQGKIAKIANQMTPEITNQTKRERNERAKIVQARILQQLTETKIFQLGMKIQCPACTQSSWYSVKSADYELQCPKCLEQISFPSASKEITWSHRTLGPFSLPNQAHGAYTVLLTLRFFSFVLDGITTSLMSFIAKKGKMEGMEADLALFFQASKFDDSKTELIFAECKTFNNFRKKDADRMANLGDMFPGAILVFATLNKSLSEKEKIILRRVVNRSRKYRKNNRPFNPVLILTGKELFLESLWDSHLDKWGPARDLFELCDLTQQLHLDVDSWDQWLDRQLGRVTTSIVPTWTTRRGETL